MPDNLLTLRAVCRLLSVRRADLLAWVDAGQFPAPLLLPNGRARWSAAAVAAWQRDPTRHRLPVDARPAVAIGDLPELAREILEAVSESPEGEWVPAAAIAAKVDPGMDPNSGHFRRCLALLKDAGLIESSRTGYRPPGQS